MQRHLYQLGLQSVGEVAKILEGPAGMAKPYRDETDQSANRRQYDLKRKSHGLPTPESRLHHAGTVTSLV